ncbi:hypothetical protein V6N13_043091 [Hibiscus sabdariffa]|uniref:Transmembrane protein n=1 Tax=Hibiscus sabdariffa TaxID=183260 RepID=A0ABR2G3I2_9ROSI
MKKKIIEKDCYHPFITHPFLFSFFFVISLSLSNSTPSWLLHLPFTSLDLFFMIDLHGFLISSHIGISSTSAISILRFNIVDKE